MGIKDFCCANGCSHDRSRGATCTFFNIPTDKELRSAWLTKIARVVIVTKDGKTVTKPWVPSKSSKLCWRHELPKSSQIYRNLLKIIILHHVCVMGTIVFVNASSLLVTICNFPIKIL